MLEIKIDPLVEGWIAKSGIQIKDIAKDAAEALNQESMSIDFLPAWSYQTASTEQYNGVRIAIEPAFFASKNREMVVRRLKYLIGHELAHPLFKKDGFFAFFRYDVLGLPNQLDLSEEGSVDCVEMLAEDVKIDSSLFGKGPDFTKGFIEAHYSSFYADSWGLGAIMRNPEKKRHLSTEELWYWTMRVERRAALAKYLKSKDKEARVKGTGRVVEGVYNEYVTNLINQHANQLRCVVQSKAEDALDRLHKELLNIANTGNKNPSKILNLFKEIADEGEK